MKGPIVTFANSTGIQGGWFTPTNFKGHYMTEPMHYCMWKSGVILIPKKFFKKNSWKKVPRIIFSLKMVVKYIPYIYPYMVIIYIWWWWYIYHICTIHIHILPKNGGDIYIYMYTLSIWVLGHETKPTPPNPLLKTWPRTSTQPRIPSLWSGLWTRSPDFFGKTSHSWKMWGQNWESTWRIIPWLVDGWKPWLVFIP